MNICFVLRPVFNLVMRLKPICLELCWLLNCLYHLCCPLVVCPVLCVCVCMYVRILVCMCVCCGFGPVLLSYDSVCLHVQVLQLHLTSLKGQDATTELVLRKVSLVPPTKPNPLSPSFLPCVVLCCVWFPLFCLATQPTPFTILYNICFSIDQPNKCNFKGPLYTQMAAHVSRNGTGKQELALYTLTLLYIPFFHITKQLWTLETLMHKELVLECRHDHNTTHHPILHFLYLFICLLPLKRHLKEAVDSKLPAIDPTQVSIH